jgi:hypothetical protein
MNLLKRSPARLPVIEQLSEWTRERFALAGDAEVHVWEVACAVPGCPPVETVVLFWIGAQRYQLKVFKPLEQVARDDLPPAWFRDALVVADGFDCDCC